LPKFADASVLVGTETADDAAVYRINAETAIVQTVDFFSPIVDDPFTFGQIAAANAISDVYAMGGTPLFALNVAGFPSKKLPLSILKEILRGGAEKAGEAGIAVLGGHTVEDSEPKYGMVVTGTVHPDRIARNRGARVGDQLVLTKPLGTGIVANAAKKGACPQAVLDAAISSMACLNRGAARAMADVAVSACTDVTGFGLLGHLRGMLLASGVGARLLASSLPVLPGVRELVAGGYVPGGSQKNRAFFGDSLFVVGATETDVALLADAQTSGGLLFSVSPYRCEALLEALRQNATPAAVRIGEVVEAPEGQVVLTG
jgi:selenide,water dikinase